MRYSKFDISRDDQLSVNFVDATSDRKSVSCSSWVFGRETCENDLGIVVAVTSKKWRK
jgi:hypothetical protein